MAGPLLAQTPRTVSYATRTLEGTDIQIGVGQPATVIAVWATWCTTCRTEFKTLDSLQTALAAQGVRVLALSVDGGSDALVRRYTDARHTHVLLARDGSGAVGKTFGTVGVPESYLVDDKGIVRWHGRGELRAGIPELRRALAVLKDPTSSRR